MLSPLKRMLLIRRFEQKVDSLFKQGGISGTTHLSAGQEACAVGVCQALTDDDLIVSNHRGHGHFLAKGGDPNALMAELFGKKTGVCGGRGGSQHIADFSIGFMGANGITGGGLPIATGIALAEKMNGSGLVTVCFIGDGAVNQGTFHESLNMAAVMELPIIYFCENNLYAMSTPFTKTSPVEKVSDRARAYNMKGLTIDGNDFLHVRDTIAELADNIRNNPQPVLIEALTYRLYGHSKSDNCEYRPDTEEEEWEQKDPIKRYKKFLLEHDIDPEEIEKADKDARQIVEKAVEFARESPFPE